MKRNDLILVSLLLILFGIGVNAQTGLTCEDPIIAFAGSNEFTGTQNTEQWFNYTASSTGKITITNCLLTSENTKISIYSGGFCVPLILKAENDDHCDAQSMVTFIGTEGFDYFVVWENLSSSNSFDWTIVESEWSDSESCDKPVLANQGNANIANHTGATDQWFAFVAPEDGKIIVSTCGITSENTSVRIFDSCSGIQLSGNDDFCDEQSEVEFSCIKDVKYLIQWESTHTSVSYNWALTYNEIPTNIKSLNEKIGMELNLDLKVISLSLPTNSFSEIKVLNISGALVQQFETNESKFELNCQGLPKGIYVLSIKSNYGVWNSKFLLK